MAQMFDFSQQTLPQKCAEILRLTERQIEFIVDSAGERLDKLILAHLPDVSRTYIQQLVKEGRVTVNGSSVKPGIKLRGGESVTVTLPAPQMPQVLPENIPLNVVYDDADVAVIDKPAGLVVHPAVGNHSGTLVNAIIARWPEIGTMDNGRIGIVHRLDKDTSGLLVIAKHLKAMNHLMAQFQNRTVEKVYLALLDRTPATPTGRVEAPIGRDPQQRKRMAVVRNGKPAISEFSVIDTDFRENKALARILLHTGRTHQIRVHMAFIGCPVVGDSVYGFRKQSVRMKRTFLHAARLCFDHPTSGERLCFDSPLPPGLQNILEKLRP